MKTIILSQSTGKERVRKKITDHYKKKGGNSNIGALGLQSFLGFGRMCLEAEQGRGGIKRGKHNVRQRKF